MISASLSPEEQNAVREFAARLRERFPREVKAIKLYGSKARGTAHEESDVDLLILVSERTKDLDEVVIDLVCDMLNTFGVFLETVTMTSLSYEEASRRQYPFILNVEHDSILL